MRVSPETKVEEIEIGSHQRCHILVGIPTLGMVPIEFVVGYGRLQMPINGQVFQGIKKGFEVGQARNMVVEDILKMKKQDRPRYLFFYGDDMIPPAFGFVQLYEEAEKNKWDCLTGLYFWKGEPPTPLIWRDDKIGRLIAGEHYKVGDVVWCDLTGLDFTLIRTSLLERMQQEQPNEPYFKTGPSLRKDVPKAITDYANPESIVMHTEDTWFYAKAKKLGARIGVHTGVRVAHLDVKTGFIY
jgi:hypothetical protein